MKSKKGFTLIELLAVLVLLGIFLTIAIPSITKYLRRGTNSYYQSLEDTIIISAKDYLSDYKALLPREIGNSTVVTLDELVNNSYIDKIVDENGKGCSGKIIVEKSSRKQYSYYTCLNCENYKSSNSKCNNN